MGGGHLPEGMRVPDYKIYSYENVNKYPHLVKYQQELAEQGLKDPWLRNIFWRYKESPRYVDGKRKYRVRGAFGLGFWTGVALFAVGVAIHKTRQWWETGSWKEEKGHGH